MLNEIKFQGKPPKIVPLIYSIIDNINEKVRIENIQSTIQSDSHITTQKTIHLGPHTIHSHLIFSPHIPCPISGEFKLNISDRCFIDRTVSGMPTALRLSIQT